MDVTVSEVKISLIEVPEPAAGPSESKPSKASKYGISSTAEFMNKVGYWFYNTKVGQYIVNSTKGVRGDRIKSVFSSETIWLLGTAYHLSGIYHCTTLSLLRQ